MDIQPQSQQPISDDQELAKVLAGISAEADKATVPDNLASDLEKESSAAPSPASGSSDDDQDATSSKAAANTPPIPPTPPLPPVPASPESDAAEPVSSGDSALETIKHDALNELRPLVDKLNVSPEEKFDTYLLLIRSTDDAALISPAHDAAKAITDEARRAQALLDIIKEIDYLSNPQKPAA